MKLMIIVEKVMNQNEIKNVNSLINIKPLSPILSEQRYEQRLSIDNKQSVARTNIERFSTPHIAR
jgi:hypothetical protein